VDINLAQVFIAFIVLLFSLTVHEMAHAWTADRLGDPTARNLGRVSLNPLVHADPIGTILFPLIALISNAPLIGWAKPVPVNFGNLRDPKRDMLWVAAAGPAINFVMALVWALLLKSAVPGGIWESAHLLLMAKIGISINLVLMALNLLPIPPLDGGRIAVSLLPMHMAHAFSRIEPYGLFVIVGLLALGVLDNVMDPLLRFGEWALQTLIGV
jgi:Zn-dependent protease